MGFAGDFNNVKTDILTGLRILGKDKLHSYPTLKLPGINVVELLSIRQFQLTKLGGDLR